jgi:glyoxylase I family protein
MRAARYVHTNLVAADWRALARFYQDAFGLEPIGPERDLSGDWLDRATGLSDARLRGIHLRLPGCGEAGPTLEIFAYDASLERSRPAAANRLGYGHIAFDVENVEAALDRVLEFGGSALGRPARAELPGVGALAVVYALDPEENVIELQSWG